MKKVEVKEGIVSNIIWVDPENIPDWCADWPDFKDSDVIGFPYEDTTSGE